MSRFVLTAQLQLQAPNNVAQVVRQIQSQLNGVTVNLQVQGAPQAQRQIQQVTQNVQQATTAAERMGRAFAVSVRRFAAFSIATRAVGLFTSTLSDAVQTAINFERQLIKVSQVTGKSVSQLRDLTNEITRLSTGLGVSSDSLLEVTTVLAQAGLSANDTKVALNSLAKAALAPNFDSISETAEGAIAILAQFQEGVGALEAQLGSINAVAGAFAVEASDLIDVIRRTGGVFKSSGGSLNELLALFTSVRATTRESAESIGTGLRTIFTRIQRPKTIEFLKQFGVELVDLEGKFVGPFEAVRRLSEGLAGLGERDITFIKIAEELGGFRQIGKVLPLLQQFATAEAALNVATKANNSLTADAASAQAALAIRIMKVKEEFLALIRSITETSTFQVFANTALSLASALIKLADSIKPLLPLLGAMAAIKLTRGIGGFLGGVGGGLASGRTFNQGGRVHKFARGGMVPGVGNGDTVPAMLEPGEFVIRKSSVKRLGASNLAAMNQNRFQKGGITKAKQMGMSTADVLASAKAQISTPRFARESGVGIATTSYLPDPARATISVDRDSDIVNQVIGGVGVSLSKRFGAKESVNALQNIFKGKKTFSYNATVEGVGKDEEKQFADIINQSISTAIDTSANRFATEVMKTSPPGQITKLPSFYNTLDQGFRGQLFESTISALAGRPLSGQDSRRPFDFTRGLGKFKNVYSNLGMDYVDAKITAGSAGLGKTNAFTTPGEDALKSKVAGQLALEVMPFISSMTKKFFGGRIQKFAAGGMASAPLVDDILANASGSILPRPSSAIASLIKAGGGAIDIDRTLKRTIGDKAYAMAKTDAAKSQVLQKYFKDETARLSDIKSSPLTSFGKELQSAIKSRQLDPKKLSIISKSSRTRGVPEYLSQLFGIPIGNMIFTGGRSKQPAMDAMRGKGPRSSRVRFATGGGVGTDTVPALLTPGEFVVSRASAQRIGYGNLNRMNKVGKYAKGGVVQRFASGTATTGVRPSPVSGSGSGGNFIPFDALSQQAEDLVNAQTQQRRSVMETVSANKMFAASMTVGLLQSFLPALDENSGAILRMSHSLLGVVSTLTTVGFALEAFGVALNTQALMQFASGASSLTQTIGNLSGQFSGVGKMLGGIGGRFGGIGKGITAAASKALPTFSGVGNVVGSAFKGGMQNKAGLFSAVKSGAIGNNPFVNMGGSMGRGATMSSMSGASGFQKFIAKTSGKAGAFVGDLSKGFTAGKMGTALPSQVSANPFASMGGSMGQKAMAGSITNTGVASFGKAIGTITKGLNASAGPLLAVQVGLMAASSAVNAFFDYQNQANKAIQEGNIEKASENSINAAAQESIDSFGSSAILAGAAIGSLVPGVGTLIGGVIGAGVALTAKFLPALEKAIAGSDYISYGFIQLGTLFGGNTYDSIKSLAAAQAQGAKTQKALNDAGEKVTQAMNDLESGTISAAQAVAASSAAGNEVTKLTEMNKKAAADNEKNKSGMGGGFLRGAARIGTLGLAGYMGLESGAQRNARIDKENKGLSEQSKKSQEDLIAKSTPAINAFSSEIAAAGGSFDDVLANMNDATSAAFNPGLYQALIQQGTGPLQKAFDNIKKEVERARKAFDAMNLGMQKVQGAADAAALGVNNYIASQQAGNVALEQSLATLEASVTSAAQGISDADFEAALGDAESTLKRFGGNQKDIDKFKQNLRAINTVQKNSGQIFADTKDKLAANIRKSTSADARKKAFSETIGESLTAQGFDPEIVKRLQDATGNLSDDQLKAIGKGNFQVFDEAIKKLGDITLEQVSGPLKAAIEIQKQLNQLTQKRIEAERNLMSAQQEALNVQMEAREIEAKYGGKAVTPNERRANIVAQANVQATGISGVNPLKTGSAAEITARTAQISARQKEIADIRKAAADPTNPRNKEALAQLQNDSGLNLEEEEKRLNEAARSQIQTTRDLIKVKEEELKTIQEKNKLEKQSMESLINGDIEKFFDQQAAVGATAAIATGNQDLMNAFGATALAGAYSDIERQKEAGVQEIYGQRIAGPGGLGEQAATAALSARGVQNPAAAQMLAGTTPAEEAINSDIRALAATMGPTADLQVQSAQDQLTAAQMQIDAATKQAQKAVDQTRDRDMASDVNKSAEADRAAKDEEARTRGREPVAYNRGGIVYASRGIFVPRGTDTVPAMLTPGEFVVRREAVNRGNNLQLLQAMNNGMSGSAGAAAGVQNFARGGKVQYLAGGGLLNGIVQNILGTDVISMLTKALTTFTSQMSDTIKSLQDTKFKITLDSTNVNVNITGNSGMLAGLTQEARNEIAKIVSDKIKNTSVGSGGKLVENTSTMPKG